MQRLAFSRNPHAITSSANFEYDTVASDHTQRFSGLLRKHYPSMMQVVATEFACGGHYKT